jgi:hypothetical protein
MQTADFQPMLLGQPSDPGSLCCRDLPNIVRDGKRGDLDSPVSALGRECECTLVRPVAKRFVADCELQVRQRFVTFAGSGSAGSQGSTPAGGQLQQSATR